MTAPLQLALFDCDGTLVDSQHTIIATMQESWRAEGLTPPSPAEVRATIGLSLDVAVARLAGFANASVVPRLVENYRTRIMALRAQPDHVEPMFEGVLDALRTLDAQGVLLGIATGKHRRGLDHVLDGHGIGGMFVTLQTADIAPSKPHPAMVLQAMADAGVEPADTVVIGDTTFDCDMARAAGVRAVGVAWGYHPPESLTAAGAVRLVEHGRDLAPAVLAALAGARAFAS